MTDHPIYEQCVSNALNKPMVAPSTPPRLINHESLYLLITLQRREEAPFWGLSVTMTDDDILIIGDSFQEHVAQLVKGYWSSACPISPTIFWKRELDVMAFNRYLVSLPCNHTERTLKPGDCILAINGRSVANFQNLKEATHVMKNTKMLSLIVLRDQGALQKAASVWYLARHQKVSCPSHQAALLAGKVLRYSKFRGTSSLAFVTIPQPSPKSVIPKTSPAYRPAKVERNPLFRDQKGDYLQFDDDHEYNPEDGSRAKLFLREINESNLSDWLKTRRVAWLASYSWNVKKRKRIEQEYEKVVTLSQDSFREWLEVRKSQWRILRRKRQRLEYSVNPPQTPEVIRNSQAQQSPTCVVEIDSSRYDMFVIDAMLDEKERQRRTLANRPPPDISFLFDASLGCPDDIVVNCLRYLHPIEHGKLLCISKASRNALSQREQVWKDLCPDHWQLPRRPRKLWHAIYQANLRVQTERSRKMWDDLLASVADLLMKGDHLQSIEKLINEAESETEFDINYTSGVVCERNSVLNLAVIHKRHKVVRWLVEVKNAHIESFDRGNFTPLLNAAWAGDKYLVRLFMQKGADRNRLGRNHYTKGIAPPDFRGLTAADWAKSRGFDEVASLLQRGL